eukprot:g15669.t1
MQPRKSCFSSKIPSVEFEAFVAKALQETAQYAAEAEEPETEGFKFTGPLRPGRISRQMPPPEGCRGPLPDYALHPKGLPRRNGVVQWKMRWNHSRAVGIDQRNSQEETFPDQSKIIDLEETCRTKSIPVLEGIDLENMRQVCLQGREVLDLAARMLRPGITGDEIDRVVYIACRDRGLYPSPLNYMGFPKSICVSVNEVICHGIPDSRPLADGDLVNLDVSVCLEGFHADLNETYLVGHCDDESHRLVRSAYNALKAATALIRPGPGSTDGDRQEESSCRAAVAMFKGFTPADVSGQNQVKSSVQRGIKQKIQEQFPRLEPVFKEIWPKDCLDANMVIAKCKDHISLVLIEKVPLFWQERDGPWLPTLRLLHKYPSMMPKMQVDKGAIKFVLRGASIMCPGLTSKGGEMEDVEEGAGVQITAEGTEHACAVGIATMSTEAIRSVNKGWRRRTSHQPSVGGTLYRQLGGAIEKEAAEHGCSVVTAFCGHGVGRLFHGPPDIPHFKKNKAVGVMKPGHVFTVEPMLNLGTCKERVWPDGWTACTRDGRRSAQFEHSFLVTEDQRPSCVC